MVSEVKMTYWGYDMLPYPAPTSRADKLQFIDGIKQRLLERYGNDIAAIGVYGSVAKGSDGPYSDIELQVISQDGVKVPGLELIHHPFKLEISALQKSDWFKKASTVDDGWPIMAGSYIHVLALYDPDGLFEKVRKIALSVSDQAILDTIREFMIWEPYETMGKIRNSRVSGNLSYLPRAAYDFTWQAAKLIGLVNKQYYSTRAMTLEESVAKPIKPKGYVELATKIMNGDLSNKEELYQLCEDLWTGLNQLLEDLGIDYRSNELEL